jgi:hypothetical protein
VPCRNGEDWEKSDAAWKSQASRASLSHDVLIISTTYRHRHLTASYLGQEAFEGPVHTRSQSMIDENLQTENQSHHFIKAV